MLGSISIAYFQEKQMVFFNFSCDSCPVGQAGEYKHYFLVPLSIFSYWFGYWNGKLQLNIFWEIFLPSDLPFEGNVKYFQFDLFILNIPFLVI